jgi:predicted O-methyltransferase YrrM
MIHASRQRVEGIVTNESQWTDPSDDCPNPELWHAPDRAATEVEVSLILGALCTALKPNHVLETGAYRGHSSEAMGQALVGIGHLDSLEVDAALAEEARARVKGLPVTLHEVSSLEFVPEHPLDLVFFDSEFDIRPLEMERFRRFATRRCVWALHDSRHDGLRAALDDLRDAGLITEPLQLPTPRGLALGRYVDTGGA